MRISEVLYRILPEGRFVQLRGKYQRFKRLVYSPMRIDEFRKVLDKLNVNRGDVVFIHSSFDKLHTAFSAKEMLDLLVERVGEEGTLLFPSWSHAGRTEDYLKSGKIFDVRRSYTLMGLLPEIARRRKSAVRSLHPAASIAAIGKHAEELTGTHHLSSYACDENSPYYKMMKYNAKIIGLGEKTVSLSFVHCIEDVMKEKFPVKIYNPQKFMAKYKDYEGKCRSMNVFALRSDNRYNNIPKFIRKNVSKEACRQMKIKGRNYFTADSVKLFDEMTSLAMKGKTIYG